MNITAFIEFYKPQPPLHSQTATTSTFTNRKPFYIHKPQPPLYLQTATTSTFTNRNHRSNIQQLMTLKIELNSRPLQFKISYERINYCYSSKDYISLQNSMKAVIFMTYYLL